MIRSTIPWVRLICALTFGCYAAACNSGGNSKGSIQKIKISGSSTIAPLMSEIGKRFEALHPGVRVDVQAGGSSRGIADARQGLADLGMVSRDCADDELDLRWIVIARDGVAMILNSANPIDALTDEQIVAIYRGDVTNWNEVGGEDRPITVVSKAEGRSTLEVFLSYFDMKNSEIDADVVIGSNQEGIKNVANLPGAIGYVSVGTAQYEVDSGTEIKLLPAQGVSASIENILSGEFPLARTLNIVALETTNEITEALIEFAQSEAVHDLIEAQYFVPIPR